MFSFRIWLWCSLRLVYTSVRNCLRPALGSLFGATSDPQFVVDSSRLGFAQDHPSCSAQLGFNSTRSKGISTVTKVITGFSSVCLCLLVYYQPWTSHRLNCFWDGFWWDRGVWLLNLPWQVLFRLQGIWWVCSPDPKPLVWICLGLLPCTQQGWSPTSLWGGALKVQVLCLPETGRLFYVPPVRGKHQFIWVYDMAVPYNQSDNPWVCICCCLFSRG